MERDVFWDEVPPDYMPYTNASVNHIKQPFMGSTADLSLSGDQMQVVNPMETIAEGSALQVPHANRGHHGSFYASPMSSPDRSRRYHNNHLHNNLRAHLSMSMSKSTLDGFHSTDIHKDPKLLWQTLKGTASNLPTPMSSYVEGWLQDHTPPRFEVTKPNTPTTNPSNTLPSEGWPADAATRFEVSKAETGNPSAQTKNEAYPIVFTMDEESDHVAVQLNTDTVAAAEQVKSQDVLIDMGEDLPEDQTNTIPTAPADEEAPVVVVTTANRVHHNSSSSAESFPEYEPPERNQWSVNTEQHESQPEDIAKTVI